MEIVNGEQAMFLRNIPSIKVSSVYQKADVVVRLDSVIRLTESYTPDSSGNIYIRGLDDFVADYVDVSGIRNIKNGSNSITKYLHELDIEVQDYGGSRDDDRITIYPCKLKCSLFPLGKRFLNRQRVRSVFDEPFFFNYVGRGCFIRISRFTKDGPGRVSDHRRTSADDELVSFSFKKSNFPDAIYIKVELFDAEDELQDTFIVNFDDSARFSKAFVFDNVFYAPESIAFRGSEKENEVVEAEYGYIDGKYKRLVNKSIKEYVINSGPLNQAEYESACDIIEAQHVYLVDGDELIPIVVTNFETEHKDPNDNPYFVTMTYRLSDRARMKIQDVENIPGMFTSPFNPVFD